MSSHVAVPRVLIAAAHKSSGKTTVSMGLGRALSAPAAAAGRGLAVQPFKKGPDYIDPMWLGRATGRACFNLDFNTQDTDEIAAMVTARARGADIVLIEGNKGLHDGVDLEGKDSNAALAKLIGAPVILVVDAEGITRGIAPLLMGYRVFDPDVNIAGVIINKIAGPRHEGKLVAAVERYCDIPVIGCLRRDDAIAVRERHLGLTTPSETGAAEARIMRIAAAVRDGVDLDKVLAVARGAAPMPVASGTAAAAAPSGAAADRVTIAIARDTAFGFYYPDDLMSLDAAGADLVFFDSMADDRLPKADALIIGGGFPETQIAALERNATLRAEIKSAIEGGLPAYVECGGLMYLCRSIEFGGVRGEMVGVVPGDAVMCAVPQGRGQVKLAETAAARWPAVAAARDSGPAGGPGWRVNAHEFHFAKVRGLPAGLDYAFDVIRGDGIDQRRDGVIVHNLVATFSHQRGTRRNPWPERFVAFVRQCKHARATRRATGSSVMSKSGFDDIIRAIDKANADDPRATEVAGVKRPYEVVYSERMTERLAAMYPDASETLRIAARGQHIRRWDIPRASFPEGRAGYDEWRKTCREHHAKLLGEIMRAHGRNEDEIARVAMLVKKQQLKKDRESQALENVVDVVFVEHYIEEFLAKYSSYDEDKVIDIVGKTLRKMSPKGHAAALALEMPEAKRALIMKAVAREADTLAKLAAVAID